MSRRVVVTGLGALCGLGIGHEEVWGKLLAGETGIAPITYMDAGDFPCRLAGRIPDFVAKDYVPQRKSLKVMARDIQIAVAAAELAARDAGLDEGGIDPERIGCSMGAGLITADIEELGPPVAESRESDGVFHMSRWGGAVMSNLYPLWLLKYLPNMLACHISIFRDARGPNNTITTGDAASAQAIGEAFQVIQRGSADVSLAGGGDSRLMPLSILRFEMLGQLTHRNDAPERAVLPFDAERDGFVPAEGAAVLILEEAEHARSRGARIYAEIAGYACAAQAARPTTLGPSTRGIALAMRKALTDAQVTPPEVGFVCAHATGSKVGDVAEAQAIREVFGDVDVPVTAPKSMIGQTCAASGGLDAVMCVLAAESDRVPPTPGFRTSDPECPVNVVAGSALETEVQYVMANEISTGGQCASMIVKKWEG